MKSRYDRQRLFAPLGAAGDDRLRASRVLVVGCGGLGGHVASQLARSGVGFLRLVDRDLVEWTNLHRQAGFDEGDARCGRPKAEALGRRLAEVNSGVRTEPHVVDFNGGNAAALARDVDLIVDGSDNLPTRFLINDLALELDCPWVYGGAVGEEAHAQAFVPGHGPCLRCILPQLPPAGTLPTCDSAGVIGPAPAAAASFQAALALRLLSGDAAAAAELAGRWIRLNLWNPAATTTHVRRDPTCPACSGGERRFLRSESTRQVEVLCGRQAVQVLPAARDRSVDLVAIARRLREAGDVEQHQVLLRFRPRREPQRLTLFRDGRALVEGTVDRAVALALYDRYVGQ